MSETFEYTITLIPYTITWDTPADGGSKINKYQIRLAIQGGGYSEWIDLKSTDTSVVMLLPNDVEITIELRAVNDVGPGEGQMLQIRPVREPNPSDGKKQIGNNSVNIHISDPPKAFLK